MDFHGLPTPLLLAVASVYGLLLVASVTVRLLMARYPEQDFGELKLRVDSWWIMVFVFTLAVLLNRTLTLAFLGVVSFLALKEYLSMIPTRRADRRVLFYAYLSIPIQYFWIGISWYGMFIIFIPVYVFLFLPLRMLLAGHTEKFLSAAGTLHWGLMVTVFGISHAAYLVVVPEAGVVRANGPSLLFYLVFLTEINDVAQYIWGKLLGRHPVAPKVSPKKTWEGLLGGVTTTVVLAVVLAPHLTPMSVGMSVIAGMIIGFGGFAGDIIISAVKRDIGVKDSGALIPGHGGILDRIDSLSFTAPLFFHFIRYYYLLP